MLVCICMGISDRDIDSAMQQGVSSYRELRKSTGLASCCGQCASYAKELVKEKSPDSLSQAFHLAQALPA